MTSVRHLGGGKDARRAHPRPAEDPELKLHEPVR
jgi:hypothetical protein